VVDTAVDQVRGVEVGTVTQAGEARDSKVGLVEVLGEVDGDVAALGDDGDVPGPELVHRRVQPGRVVEHAEAVRTQQ
jgi:hypothetical protein